MSSEEDVEGCVFGVIILTCAALLCGAIWSYNHPTPEESARRQQVKQSEQDTNDLNEGRREKDLREMRADKARAEQPEKGAR